MKKTIALLSILFCIMLLRAQPTQFTVGFNDICSIHAENNLKQTNDGGYIFTSMRPLSLDTGNPAVVRGYLVKMGPSGSVQWVRMFPCANFTIKVGSSASVIQTSDSGYVVATAYFFQNAPNSPMYECTYLIKTDVNGNLLWSRRYSGRGSSRAFCVTETADHGLIVSGITADTIPPGYVEGYLLRTDSVGNVIWAKSYGDPVGQVEFHSVVELNSGEFVTVGAGPFYAPVMKTDANGTLMWCRRTGGYVAFFDVDADTSGNLTIIGLDYTNVGTALYRIDSAGSPLWASGYGYGGVFQGTSIVQDATGFTMAGNNGGLVNQGLAHIDFNGNPVWNYVYPELDVSIRPTLEYCSDSGYIFPGVHENSSVLYDWSYVITKTDNYGRGWCDSAVVLTSAVRSPLLLGTLSTTSVPGVLQINTQLSPVMFTEYHPCQPSPLGVTQPDPEGSISIYPNPTDGNLAIHIPAGRNGSLEVRICDITGRIVMSQSTTAGDHNIDTGVLSAGLYFVLLECNGELIAQEPLLRK